jgi:hypothetical protein
MNQNDDQLNALLREAAERLTLLPPTLTPNIERRLRTAIWRRRIVATVTLAASIAGIWLASHLAFPPMPPTPMLVKTEPPPQAPKPARPDVRITFPKDANVIAVPIESDNPNVTVVMVYQAVRPTPKHRSDQ